MKAIFFLSILIVAGCQVQSQAKRPPNVMLDALVRLETSLDGAILSVCTSSPRVQFNHTYTLPAASTIKLLTTATALDQLGSDFRFQTIFGYSGRLNSNNLEGDLILKGGGDPSFSPSQNYHEFRRWAGKLKRRNIKTVAGDLIVDASIFEEQALADTWLWEDVGNWYGGGATGFNILHNIYTIEFAPTTALDQLTKIQKLSPYLPTLIFKNEVHSAGRNSGDQAYIYGSTYSKIRIIRGTIPMGERPFKIKGALPNPPLYAGELFKKILAEAGVEVKGTVKVKKIEQSFQVLDTIFSDPLSDLIKRVNQKSDNLYAESIFKILGAGSSAKAAVVLENFLAQISSDSHFNIADGCGLSPRTAMSTQTMVDLLDALKSKSYFDLFYKSLAVSSESGTLKNTFTSRKLTGKVHAKSGSMSGVRTYAGYLETSDNELISFSVVIYNHRKTTKEVKAMVEEILLSLFE